MSGAAIDAITPHGGGELADLQAPEAERAGLRKYLEKLPAVALNARDLADLEMLATGAFSPLTGFMGEADYVGSRDKMRLASGLPWPIPITLGAAAADAGSLGAGQDVALAGEDGSRLALLKLAEVYRVDRKREAEAVFGTGDEAHPGVKNVLATPPWCLAGNVTLVEEIPRALPRVGLEEDRRLPDPQPDPSRARVYTEGGARDLRRPAAPSAGGRNQG
jgi:ATP sulfurylase